MTVHNLGKGIYTAVTKVVGIQKYWKFRTEENIHLKLVHSGGAAF
jgi:hypothetical protein